MPANGRWGRVALLVLAALAGLGASTPARADWTWNVGYQNPAGSTFGLNLLYLGTQWGIEFGVGDRKSTRLNSSH